jgi:diadenylate cyclase
MDWLPDNQILNEIIRPALDIIILSFLIYRIYTIFVQTRAVQLVKGAFIVLLVYAAAFFLQLNTLLWIMNRLATVIVLILAIVFQPELRNIVMRLGQGQWFKLATGGRPEHLESVLSAVEVLAGRRRGGLIVFMRSVGIKNILDTGTKLNADLSTSLIITIFGHETPLHDGAIIVQGGKVVAAGCFLPLSEQADIRRSFGTRHRAALGLAEVTDAVVVVVSEESGAISLAHDANLYYDLSIEEARSTLKRLLRVKEESPEVGEETALEE